MVDITYWMDKDFPTTSKETIILEAVNIMKNKKFDALIVIEDDKPVGIFTERDLLVKVVAARMNPEVTQVVDAMTSPIETVDKNKGYNEVLHIMREKNFRHVPVVDENGKIIGIVTMQGLMRTGKK